MIFSSSSLLKNTRSFLSIFCFVPSFEASTSRAKSLFLPLSIKTMDTFVPVVAKIFGGIVMQPLKALESTRCFLMLFSMLLCAVIKPVGTTMAALPVGEREFSKCWKKHRYTAILSLSLLGIFGTPAKKRVLSLASSFLYSLKSSLKGGLLTIKSKLLCVWRGWVRVLPLCDVMDRMGEII